MRSILERPVGRFVRFLDGNIPADALVTTCNSSHYARPKGTNRMPTAVTTQTFEEEVLQSEKPVIVDFWAEWCGPCHAVSPVLDKIAEERSDELKLVKINVDEEQELMIRYGVQSIPTIVLFKDGAPAAAVIGAQPKGAIERGLGLVEAAA